MTENIQNLKNQISELKAENSSTKEELQQLKIEHEDLQHDLENSEAALRIKESEGKQFVNSMLELFNSGLSQAKDYRKNGFFS